MGIKTGFDGACGGAADITPAGGSRSVCMEFGESKAGASSTPTTSANGGNATPGGNSGATSSVSIASGTVTPVTPGDTDATYQSAQFVGSGSGNVMPTGVPVRVGDGQLSLNTEVRAGAS